MVDIEPRLEQVAEKYFDLGDYDRIESHFVDARRFMTQAPNEAYDLIFGDVYQTLYSIPSHVTTSEFFALTRDKLSEDGIFIMNAIGALQREQPSLTLSQWFTFTEVFPDARAFAVRNPYSRETQNLIFIGSKNGNLSQHSFDEIDIGLADFAAKEIDFSRFNLATQLLLTDSYAPVDALTTTLYDSTAAGEVSGAEMMATLRDLQAYGPRHPLDGEERADTLDFLESNLRAVSDEVIRDEFSVEVVPGERVAFTNFLARINPAAERRVLLGAHYDTHFFADAEPVRREKITGELSERVPGANDSGSGVVVLLEALAHWRSTSEPEIGVDVVFFDGEEGVDDVIEGTEWVMYGSEYMAENLSNYYAESTLEQVVVVDMVCDKRLNIYQEKNSLMSSGDEHRRFFDIAINKIGPRLISMIARSTGSVTIIWLLRSGECPRWC